MTHFLSYVLFGLFEAVTMPVVLALELVSSWGERPAGVFGLLALAYLAICMAWGVYATEFDISDEALR